MSFANASSSVIAYGSTLSFATITAGAAGTYAKVAQTVDLDSPTEEAADINITNNDSPGNRKEYRQGMVEPGDMEFSVVFAAAMHLPVIAMNGDGITRAWKETFTDGTTCTYPAYVKSAGVTGKTEDEVLKGTIKLKLTGPPAWVAGS